MNSLTTIINNHLSSLTQSDVVICDFLKVQMARIPDMTLQQLAEETYSSKSTILRLLKKFNFSGFTDFKYYLLNHSTATTKQDFNELLVSLERLDFDLIAQKLGHLIETCHHLYFFVTGQDQQIQAKNFSNYLLKKGIISTVVPLNASADLTANILTTIGPEDLIVVFSSQGNNDSLKACFSTFPKDTYHIVSFTAFKDGWIQSKAELAVSLGIQQFADPTFAYQSGLMHLLLNILSTRLAVKG